MKGLYTNRFRYQMIAAAIVTVIFIIGSTITKIQDAQRSAEYDLQYHETRTATVSRLTQRFGTLPIELCNQLGTATYTPSESSLPPQSHLLAVRMQDLSIYDAYQSVMPQAATSAADLDAVVCIRENDNTIYRKYPYQSLDNSNAPITYYCNLHRVDFEVTVINAKSRQIVMSRTFKGSETNNMGTCPSINSMDIDWDTDSDPPLPQTIAQWLNSGI